MVSIVISVSTAHEEDRATAWIEGFAILVAVMVCSTVAAANDYQKEKQFQALNETAENRKHVQVVRNGRVVELKNTEILVGDLV